MASRDESLFDTGVTAAPVPEGSPTVLSWGLGADSTAIIAGFCEDPAAYGLRPDLSDLVVITALTGDEWPDTMALAERHVLPLLRRHRVRLVQVARGGRADSDGVAVMSDTRGPEVMHRRGPWALSDELTSTGTVPQVASGRRICSIKFKGWVIDSWCAAEFGDRPYRHVIGYEAGETRRARRDQTYTSATRRPWYPLIEWGWDRARILRHLAEEFGVPEWPKSYCAQCPFPGVAASLDKHLARCREFPELAATVLRMERVAMSLNHRSTLFADGSLMAHIRRDGNTAALDAFEDGLDTTAWCLYEVRRIYFAARTADCRASHGQTCRDPQPSCRDPYTKGTAWRSVRARHTGTRADVRDQLARQADAMDEVVIAVDGIARARFREPGETYPTGEGFLVAAPAGVADKERPGFEDRWAAVTGATREQHYSQGRLAFGEAS